MTDITILPTPPPPGTGVRPRLPHAGDTRRGASGTRSRPDRAKWLNEASSDAAGQRLRVARTVARTSSRHQDIWVFENPVLGRVLALDGHVQTTAADEFIYHEMMAHVPMFAHGAARDVLIVGGGDGGVLREVLKHASVRRAVVVELDRAVIETSRRHLPSVGAGAFDDPRAHIVVDDGPAFLRRTWESFDVILVDAPDPVGPGTPLFGPEFLRACHARLRPGGILVIQSGVSFLQIENIRRTMSHLRAIFPEASAYTATVPTYYGGAMTFACASDAAARFAVTAETLAMRYAAARIRTRCYTPALHVASFVLPGYLAERLRRRGPARHGGSHGGHGAARP